MSSFGKAVPFGNDIVSAWSYLTRNIPLSRINSRRQYDLVVKAMEYLADVVDDDPKHSLVGLLEILEMLVEDYDQLFHQIPKISGKEILRNLMVEHGLRQSDLSELGTQGVVSEILSGRRRLNKRHADVLAKRFSLPEKLFENP